LSKEAADCEDCNSYSEKKRSLNRKTETLLVPPKRTQNTLDMSLQKYGKEQRVRNGTNDPEKQAKGVGDQKPYPRDLKEGENFKN